MTASRHHSRLVPWPRLIWIGGCAAACSHVSAKRSYERPAALKQLHNASALHVGNVRAGGGGALGNGALRSCSRRMGLGGLADRIASRAGGVAFREQCRQSAGRRCERRYFVRPGYWDPVHPTGAGRGEAYRYRKWRASCANGSMIMAPENRSRKSGGEVLESVKETAQVEQYWVLANPS